MSKARPAIVKSVSLKDAVYAYVSECCTALADKPSLKAANKIIKPHLGAQPEAAGTLGKWRCSACRKSCKVRPADKAKYLRPEPKEGA